MTLARDQRTFWKVKILLEIANDPNQASCLLFTWFILPWLLPLLWTIYGLLFVCSIITIVLQHKVRVQFLKKQREKGPDSWYSPENRFRIVIITLRFTVGCTVGNPEEAHFQIMNHAAKPVVVWHGAVAWCLDKCIRRWTSTSADIKIGNSPKRKFLCVFFPDISAQSTRLKRYHGQILPLCNISQHLI